VASKSRFSHENLNRKVAEYLREEILWSGRFKTGQHIQEMDIAEELNISRAPVREALRELEHQGIVNYLPRRGTFVATFDHDDFQEIVDIRFMIESRVIDILVGEGKLGPEDFSRLRGLIDQMVSISRSESPLKEKISGYSEKDVQFHRYIWERSGRKWSLKILTDIFYQLRLAMMQDMILEQDMVRSAEMHYEIIDRLEKSDAEGAKKMLLRHIFSLWKERSRTEDP